ncbi:MAG: hypothetical protein K6G22_10410 [Lachnospiraceae bacterium]|nr:hypothetical protein [Lachnospiraceae bacterium]
MKKTGIISIAIAAAFVIIGCGNVNVTINRPVEQSVIEYSDDIYPLERNGTELFLSALSVKDARPEKNILLVHGVTYSSHEFDIDYKDYSLARALAREGYCVWRLDIAGFGRSGEVSDGFLPDSDYAAEDMCALMAQSALSTLIRSQSPRWLYAETKTRILIMVL